MACSLGLRQAGAHSSASSMGKAEGPPSPEGGWPGLSAGWLGGRRSQHRVWHLWGHGWGQGWSSRGTEGGHLRSQMLTPGPEPWAQSLQRATPTPRCVGVQGPLVQTRDSERGETLRGNIQAGQGGAWPWEAGPRGAAGSLRPGSMRVLCVGVGGSRQVGQQVARGPSGVDSTPSLEPRLTPDTSGSATECRAQGRKLSRIHRKRVSSFCSSLLGRAPPARAPPAGHPRQGMHIGRLRSRAALGAATPQARGCGRQMVAELRAPPGPGPEPAALEQCRPEQTSVQTAAPGPTQERRGACVAHADRPRSPGSCLAADACPRRCEGGGDPPCLHRATRVLCGCCVRLGVSRACCLETRDSDTSRSPGQAASPHRRAPAAATLLLVRCPLMGKGHPGAALLPRAHSQEWCARQARQKRADGTKSTRSAARAGGLRGRPEAPLSRSGMFRVMTWSHG